MKPSTEAFLKEINEVCKKHGKRVDPQLYGYFEIREYSDWYFDFLQNVPDFTEGDE